MSIPQSRTIGSIFELQFPQSVGIYSSYADAQKAVDYLADEKFAVQNLAIVGTDLKRIERITGRLTTGRVAAGGLLSGIWLGLFVGLIFTLFTDESVWGVLLSTIAIGALFGPSQVAARLCELIFARNVHPLAVARFAVAMLIAGFVLLAVLGLSAPVAAATPALTIAEKLKGASNATIRTRRSRRSAS